MAEITQKRIGELVRKVFEILLSQQDSLQAKEVLRRLEQAMSLTEFEKGTFPNSPNIRRFDKIVRFGTIPTVKAGWLLKSKGRWEVTEKGERAFRQITDPEQFNREAVRLFRKWKASQPAISVDAEQDTPSAGTTIEEAEEAAWNEIQAHVQGMDPYDYQKMAAALLRALGYYVSWVAPPGPDKGFDILAHKDPLGTSPPRIKVQVKRRADKIGVDVLRSFVAVLGDQDVGIFLATGGFTKEAADLARTQETRKITLLGMEEFFDLWVQCYDKIPETEKKLLPLRPVYYLAPSD